MRRTMLLASAFALVLVLQARAQETARGGASKLVGTWTVTHEEKGGTRVSEDKLKGRQVKITRDTITCMSADGKHEMVCRYEVTTTSTPWKLDLTCTEGEHKGKRLHGIAKLEDNNLQICFSKPDQEAPTRFDSTREGQCCMTLKRESR